MSSVSCFVSSSSRSYSIAVEDGVASRFLMFKSEVSGECRDGLFTGTLGGSAVSQMPCAVSASTSALPETPDSVSFSIGSGFFSTYKTSGSLTSVNGANVSEDALCKPVSISSSGVISAKLNPASRCVAGTHYSAVDKNCVPAPAGSFVSSNGASKPTLCPAGSFSSTRGSMSCTKARPGFFVSVPGSQTQTPCPAGSYADREGSTSCTPAPAGSFVSEAGSVAATPCLMGSYSSTKGASSCITAPAGTFVPTNEATSPTPCPAGSFSSTGGSIACTKAPAGAYAMGEGNTRATACPTGSFTDKVGSSSCSQAPAGSFVSSSGASRTTPCAAGTFSASSGASSCNACPFREDRFSSTTTGNATQEACYAGSASCQRVSTRDDFEIDTRLRRNGYYETLTCASTAGSTAGVLKSDKIPGVSWNCSLVPNAWNNTGTLGWMQTDVNGKNTSSVTIVNQPTAYRRVGAWSDGMETCSDPTLTRNAETGGAEVTVRYKVAA